MRFLKELRHSSYFRLVLILILFYIVSNAAGSPFNKFDYIIVLYILTLPKVDEDTALQYSILFGIFYDLNFQIFLGLGILLFQLLCFLKVQFYQRFDMSKMQSQIGFAVGLILLYIMLTLKFYGYASSVYWHSVLYFFINNLIALVIISLILGGKRALSYSQR